MTAIDEHALIARYFRPLATDPAALDLRDDAAVLSPPAGCDLVLTKDGIAEGIHFLPGESGDAVARKALRVNLSDLAAKGADPLGYLVLLALPPDWTEDWVARFAEGLAADQAEFGIALYGGDTIRAPTLVISVAALGLVPHGEAVRRSGAVPGDVVFVSGTIGEGALGLLAARGELDLLGEDERARLVARYRQPQPRVALAPALRAQAHAAIDISDGLAGDLDKLCQVSGVSAEVNVERIPLSPAARAAIASDPALLDRCLAGGDDYEILCAVAPERALRFEEEAMAAGVPVHAIGTIVEGAGPARFTGPDGSVRLLARRSFSHTG